MNKLERQEVLFLRDAIKNEDHTKEFILKRFDYLLSIDKP